jgi:hypothetical protein
MIPTLLTALAKLHNFCIDENDKPTRERLPTDSREGDELRVRTNPEENPKKRKRGPDREIDDDERMFLENAIEGRRRRNGFSLVFQKMGYKRPAYSAHTRA